ncbi:MAG: MFS transporter, partial [Candidatus Heimdallarchaeota archaeon]|nr:MFS transporter [Candidatus Heimdallarchaeota archaeon]MCK5048976.1 MFS transporter [Candidatus Heimdallarchaeota archaeon]
ISYKEFLKGIKKPMILGLSLIFGVLFLATVNGTIAKPLIIVYLTKNIESNPTLATIAYIPAGVTSMLLAPKLGRVADKLNPRLTIAFTSAMGGIITYFLVNTDSLIIFSILLTFDVAIGTTTYLVVQSLMSKISIGNRGKMFGLQTIFTNIGAIIGPIVGGVLWDSYGMKSPFYFSIFVEILLIPFYIIAIISISPHLDEF